MSKSNAYLDRRRTSYEDLKNPISTYFLKWLEFYNEYELLIEFFFNLLGQKSMIIEDQFVTWCRLLDGYFVRKCNEESKSENLKDKIIDILKQSDIEASLKIAFKEAKSEYNRKNIAGWIQAGFTNRITFGEKLRRICKDNFNFILLNSERIFNETGMNENEIYKRYNATRNYYSHLKANKDDCLTFVEMFYSNDILFCTVISIFLHEIGFNHEEVKEILRRDSIVWQYHMGE